MVTVAGFGFTTSTVAAEVDVAKLAAFVGTNFAVSECDPIVSVVVAKVAVPAATGVVPRTLVPSRNWMDPAAAVGVTPAVSSTDAPWITGPAGVTASVVTVATGGGLTTSVLAAEVDGRYAAVPGVNVADRECEPTASAEVVSVADPAATVAVPSEVTPSKNCTVPVAAVGAIVAFRATDVPETTGPAGVTVSVVVVAPGGAGFTT